MAGYTIREINGYYVIFAGALVSDRKQNSEDLPSSVRIIRRSPSIKEYQYLASSVGWSLYTDDAIVEKMLAAPLFAVVAEIAATNEVAGCALLLVDDASFYYVKDVIVHPRWQSKHVGTAMMKELTLWLENNGADKAMVALITPETLAPFYQQFSFAPAFSMVTHIQRND
jgi:GNAT superfamily N-acetyltransferase